MAAPHVKVTDTYGTYYYIDSSSSSDILTWEEMKTNATYFFHYITLQYPAWTKQAIAAMLGNIQSEGALNPAQWEYGKGKRPTSGYGLVQWTPSTKFTEWATSLGYALTAIGSQIERLEFERSSGIQYYKTAAYPETFTQFLASTKSADYLAAAWLYNYERPKDPAATVAKRKRQALVWYEFITGEAPEPPDPGPTPINLRKGMSFLYYHRPKPL